MKKRIDNTDTISEISRKTGIPESVFRNDEGRKIRKDCQYQTLKKKGAKK